jgi:hypothetical protein
MEGNDIRCKIVRHFEESKWLFTEMERNNVSPNLFTKIDDFLCVRARVYPRTVIKAVGAVLDIYGLPRIQHH